ncbi:hypothetical protein BDV93DRAFT_519995 [Ceratobasidium sp. AG-I]|nr:hypothetical protein BDV93DRAFT_519995 [Ceratobasidium sp. AG-I]
MSRSRLPAYALIIAINDPPGIAFQGRPLRAPEPDAIRLRDTLISLGIPQSSIDVLSGRAATRQNIIEKLREIATSPRIQPDTPILIYYAGHGTREFLDIPSLGKRVVECLCPFDTLMNRAFPIPDITLSALLGRIAKNKSKYITLLLDCCHSGGASRDSEAEVNHDNPLSDSEELLVDQDALFKLDGDLWSKQLENSASIDVDESSRVASTHPSSFRYHGVTSHVLIAACREDEVALEYTAPRDPAPRGVFTEALINALRDSLAGNILWSLTHKSLFERIKEGILDIYEDNPRVFRQRQTPQCEGFYRDRYVFATPAYPHQQHAVAPLTFDHGAYELPVGILAGVYSRAKFEIYDYSSRGERRRIGVLDVIDVNENTTKLKAPKDLGLSPSAYAVMCSPPIALPIDVAREVFPIWSDRGFQTDLSTRLGSHEPVERFIAPIRSGGTYKLRISSSSSHSVQIQTIYGSVINIRRSSTASIIPSLSDALAKAVMFFHHLDQSSRVPNADLFDAHILELVEAPITDWAAVDRGHVNALIPRRGAAPMPLRSSGLGLSLPAPSEPTTPFGLQLANRAPYNFFIYIFYFDPGDFSITPIYTPPSSDRAIPPLPARGILSIGFGDSGAGPLHFSIDEQAEKDLGFFKVYYSTAPSDMNTIQQEGFDPDSRDSSRPVGSHHTQSPLPYGSVVYPVTVTNPRRHRR